MFNFFKRKPKSVGVGILQRTNEQRIDELEKSLEAICNHLDIWISRPSTSWKVIKRESAGGTGTTSDKV